MGWELVLVLFFTALLALMLTGINVFVAFLIVNLGATVLLIGPSGFGLFTNSIFSSATTGGFATIPLFILMGEVLFRSGSVDVLFDSVDRLVGQVKGRLYFVVILIATIFGALSGSAIAVTAMLGRSALPNMAARGYSTRLSASVILAGASLAPIMPPSLLAIIVGSLADVSIAGLLIAGIVPGLIIAALTAIHVGVSVAYNPALAPAAATGPASGAGAGAAALRMLPFLIIIFMVMGLIMLGIATPGESAATGVAGAVVVAAIYRKLSLSMLLGSLQSATRISVMILIIVISSTLFSQLVAFSGASEGLGRMVQRTGSAAACDVRAHDAAAARSVHVHRPGGIPADGGPSLWAAGDGIRLRSDLVLDAVSREPDRRRGDAAIRLYAFRACGGCAAGKDGHGLSGKPAGHRDLPARNDPADLRARAGDLVAGIVLKHLPPSGSRAGGTINVA